MFEWSYGLITPKKWRFIWRKSSQTWLVGLWKILINRQIVAEILLARTGIWQFDDKNEWFTVFKTNQIRCANRCPKNMLWVGNHRNSRMHIHQVYDLQRDGRCKHVARNEDRDFAGSRSLALRILTSFIMYVFFFVGEVLFLKCLSVFLGWLNKNLFFGLILGISTAQKNFSCLMIWGTGAHVSSCVFGMLVEDRR